MLDLERGRHTSPPELASLRLSSWSCSTTSQPCATAQLLPLRVGPISFSRSLLAAASWCTRAYHLHNIHQLLLREPALCRLLPRDSPSSAQLRLKTAARHGCWATDYPVSRLAIFIGNSLQHRTPPATVASSLSLSLSLLLLLRWCINLNAGFVSRAVFITGSGSGWLHTTR